VLDRFCLQLHGTLPIEAYPRLAARAEALGFEDVTVHDLLMRRPVWPLLCDVARATERVLVGPNVTHPHLTHPAMIAASMAHLDELSGGRGVLGIGRGSLYGLVGQANPSSLRGLEEAVAVVRRLLRDGSEPVTGEHFALKGGAVLLFGPRRDVPVYIGTIGEAGARLAGQIADGVRAAGQWDPSWMVRLRACVAEGAEAAGRDPADVDLVVENWSYLGEDRDQARQGARRLLTTFLPHLGAMLRFYRVRPEELAGPEAITDATLDRFMAAGDASDLRRGLDRLEDAGFSAVSFSGSLGPDTDAALEIIGAEMARRR
jgi:5,10-methylenetetrahydromethanopterin reductase